MARNDPSEADLKVLKAQINGHDALNQQELEKTITIDTESNLQAEEIIKIIKRKMSRCSKK